VAPSGWVSGSSDCDDSLAAVNPAATEVCNGRDDDCDSLADDLDSSLDSSTGTVYYRDVDGDGQVGPPERPRSRWDLNAARALLRLSGPLATTSANRSGEAAATCAREAAALFPALALLAPIPWAPGSGQASTVLAWNAAPEAGDGSRWRVLRGSSAPTLPAAGGGAV
jgi:hypothetical protein